MYSGCRNKDGKPHGRGSVVYIDEDGAKVIFQGHFSKGLKNGRGMFCFSDGSTLTGRWKDGQLCGIGVYAFIDGSFLQQTYIDGECTGPGTEWDASGHVLFQGSYLNGQRHGPGTLYMMSANIEIVKKFGVDGKICGTWQEGELQGKCTFSYPNNSFLVGEWKDGKMAKARFNGTSEKTYRYDPSTKDRISSFPLLADPYESSVVEVRVSNIKCAGEGLFAKYDIAAGTVVAYYNGVRSTCNEVDSRPDWSLNANVINLDEHTALDVPPCFASCEKYCASLGHKVNHASADFANCTYDEIEYHPRFGHIKCVRLLRDVKCGEELFVSYGYKDEFPPWWST